jgi:hypothetical protein
MLLFESEAADHVERVDGWIERKTEALLRHRSQWRSTMGIDETDGDRRDQQRAAFVTGVHDEARNAGLRGGLRAAEAFARIDAL